MNPKDQLGIPFRVLPDERRRNGPVHTRKATDEEMRIFEKAARPPERKKFMEDGTKANKPVVLNEKLIREEFKAGLTVQAISQKYGKNPRWIKAQLTKLGLTPRTSPKSRAKDPGSQQIRDRPAAQRASRKAAAPVAMTTLESCSANALVDALIGREHVETNTVFAGDSLCVAADGPAIVLIVKMN